MKKKHEPYKSKYRHFFIRNGKLFPVGCVATDKKDDNILFGISVCNPLDNTMYQTIRGIEIAERRLDAYKTGEYDNTDNLGASGPALTLKDQAKQMSARFRLAAVGLVPIRKEKGFNLKNSLLNRLASDVDLPRRFREDIGFHLAMMEQRKKKREEHEERMAQGN